MKILKEIMSKNGIKDPFNETFVLKGFIHGQQGLGMLAKNEVIQNTMKSMPIFLKDRPTPLKQQIVRLARNS